MLYVVKRDGREVVFNKDKISNAIRKASKEVSKELDHNEIINITENVYKSINWKIKYNCGRNSKFNWKDLDGWRVQWNSKSLFYL